MPKHELVSLADLKARVDWTAAYRLFPGAVAYVWHAGVRAGEVQKGDVASWNGGRKQTTVWDIPVVSKKDGDFDPASDHSTQKPVECMRRPILNHTRVGASVYEPFSGSGSTIIAAETTARVCLAVELSPVYVEQAVRRWERFTGQTARLDTGETLADLALSREAVAAGPAGGA